jgi:hypothetical protein
MTLVHSGNGIHFVIDVTRYDDSYELGSTPLVLLWKDKHCSPFPVDTSSDSTTTVDSKQVLAVATLLFFFRPHMIV